MQNAAPVDSLGVSFVLAVLPLAVLFIAVIKLKVRAKKCTWSVTRSSAARGIVAFGRRSRRAARPALHNVPLPPGQVLIAKALRDGGARAFAHAGQGAGKL